MPSFFFFPFGRPDTKFIVISSHFNLVLKMVIKALSTSDALFLSLTDTTL